MDQASFSLKATHSACTGSESKPRRDGYLKILLATLHHSRRLQAERILRQHAALFEKAGQPLHLTKLEDR
jgi:hypothetical protein